jgi:GAF domain-containing protein
LLHLPVWPPKICGTPIALVTLLDSERQWFKSKVGVEATQTPRELAFCAHTILGNQPLLVPDLRQDPRFSSNPLVISPPNIRFYCGVSLEIEKGLGVGTLCVIDRQPRQLTPDQVEDLAALAARRTRTSGHGIARSYRIQIGQSHFISLGFG